MPTCIMGDLPKYRVPQRKERDLVTKEMVAEKLANVIANGYIALGLVLSLTSYFPVQKG